MAQQRPQSGKPIDRQKLDKVVADARNAAKDRLAGYREQSLRLHPWICGRCGREFNRSNLHELTVHHIDHNHDNNPADGSNWENLCLYCHDHEHQKNIDSVRGYTGLVEVEAKQTTFNPFADLKQLLDKS